MNIVTIDVEEWFHLLDHPSTEDYNNWLKFETRIHNNVERIILILKQNK